MIRIIGLSLIKWKIQLIKKDSMGVKLENWNVKIIME